MKSIKSANNYGWVVDSSEAEEALEMWLDYRGGDEASVLDDLAKAMGYDVLKENVEWIARHWGFAEDIEDAEDGWSAYETARELMGADSLYDEMTRAMGSDELAEDLAYIFRMNDFQEWDERNGGEEEEIESACHGKGKKKDKKEIKSAKENDMSIEKITPNDLKEAYDYVTSEPTGTWYKKLYEFDDGSELCLAAGMAEGFDNGSRPAAKLAVLPGNSGMSEYNYDFLMPWDSDGNVWDTEVSDFGESDADWFNEQAAEIVKGMESGELAITSGCHKKGKKKDKKEIKSAMDSRSLGNFSDDIIARILEVEDYDERTPSVYDFFAEGDEMDLVEFKQSCKDLAEGQNGYFQVDDSSNSFKQIVNFYTSDGADFGDETMTGSVTFEVVLGLRNDALGDYLVASSKKPLKSMARQYMKPQYDARKSFYNKAETDDDKLYSYGTLVAEIIDGEPVLHDKWDYSATTLRHVKDWLQQNGFEAGSKQEIGRMYKKA